MDCSPRKWPLLEGSTSLQGLLQLTIFVAAYCLANFLATQASGKLSVILTPLKRSLERNSIKFYFHSDCCNVKEYSL